MVESTETTALIGIEQIRRIIPRSAATILALKNRYPNMPIHREHEGGVWVSDREELLTWWRLYVRGEAHIYAAPEPQAPEKDEKTEDENETEEQVTEDEPLPAEDDASTQRPATGRGKKTSRG